MLVPVLIRLSVLNSQRILLIAALLSQSAFSFVVVTPTTGRLGPQQQQQRPQQHQMMYQLKNGVNTITDTKTALHASENDATDGGNDENNSGADSPGGEGLILGGDEMEAQLQKLRSKFPTSEADYLTAARKRAEEARESVNNQSSDDDWKNISEQKRSSGLLEDDWVASLGEAGNSESQILIPVSSEEKDDQDGGPAEEEPKLLLF